MYSQIRSSSELQCQWWQIQINMFRLRNLAANQATHKSLSIKAFGTVIVYIQAVLVVEGFEDEFHNHPLPSCIRNNYHSCYSLCSRLRKCLRLRAHAAVNCIWPRVQCTWDHSASTCTSLHPFVTTNSNFKTTPLIDARCQRSFCEVRGCLGKGYHLGWLVILFYHRTCNVLF